MDDDGVAEGWREAECGEEEPLGFSGGGEEDAALVAIAAPDVELAVADGGFFHAEAGGHADAFWITGAALGRSGSAIEAGAREGRLGGFGRWRDWGWGWYRRGWRLGLEEECGVWLRRGRGLGVGERACESGGEEEGRA